MSERETFDVCHMCGAVPEETCRMMDSMGPCVRPPVSRAAGGETEGVSDAVMAWLLEQRAEAIDVRDGVPHYSLRYQHLDAVIRALSSAPAPEASELLDAARALVERLDLVHANDDYRGVWSLAFAHGHRYAGPTYEAELARLRAALGASAQTNTGEAR